jgi:hypothetical protein
MKKTEIVFLKTVVLLIGFIALFLLIRFPQLEGVNVNNDLFTIYFKDPFLAYVYIGSIAFFVAIYQTFKLLGNIANDTLYSEGSVKALRNIKYCAMTIVGFIIGAEAYIIINMAGSDDIAGGVAMGVFITFGSIVVAVVSDVFIKILEGKAR